MSSQKIIIYRTPANARVAVHQAGTGVGAQRAPRARQQRLDAAGGQPQVADASELRVAGAHV
jgi:hypothetical protein